MGSSWRLMSKTGVTEPWDEPNEPRMRLASRGSGERKSWTGRSLWLCYVLASCPRKCFHSAAIQHTISTVPLPDSLTVRAYGASRPEASLTTRNAWCGLFPLDPSFVVNETLILSPCRSVTVSLTRSLSVKVYVLGALSDDLEETSTFPSEKPHEVAALVAPARKASVEAMENRIVEVLVVGC